jgi:hypothetical protein
MCKCGTFLVFPSVNRVFRAFILELFSTFSGSKQLGFDIADIGCAWMRV